LFSVKPIPVLPLTLWIAAMVACGGGGGSTPGNPQTSGGSGWQIVSTPAAATQINFVAFNNSNHWFIADRNHGFFRSTDQGATWTTINNGIVGTSGSTISVNPATGTLIAATSSPGSPNGAFYRSTNEGATWTAIPLPFTINTPAYTGCVFGARTVCGGFWAPSPASGLWSSGDDGITTAKGLLTPMGSTAVFSVAINQADGSVWLGTEQYGAFRSTDGGLTFSQASPPDQNISSTGIRDGNVDSIAFDNSGDVFMATQGGVWRSSAGGPWVNVKANGNTAAGRILAFVNGVLYYGHNYDTKDPTVIYQSTDDGDTWSAYDSGIPSAMEGYEFVVNPADNKLYAVIEDEVTHNGWLYCTVNPVQ
jgi:hypothetical protein